MEDEKLFIRLCIMDKRPEDTDELIKAGYATEGFRLTPKARGFQDRFIKEHKERLFQAMRDEGSDIPKAMQRTGIEFYLSFLFIGERLFQEGRFIKDENHEYKVK